MLRVEVVLDLEAERARELTSAVTYDQVVVRQLRDGFRHQGRRAHAFDAGHTSGPLARPVHEAGIELHDTVLQRAPIDGYESLDPDRIYRLVTTDYYAETWSDRGIELEWTDTGVNWRDMVIAWIAARESVPMP